MQCICIFLPQESNVGHEHTSDSPAAGSRCRCRDVTPASGVTPPPATVQLHPLFPLTHRPTPCSDPVPPLCIVFSVLPFSFFAVLLLSVSPSRDVPEECNAVSRELASAAPGAPETGATVHCRRQGTVCPGARVGQLVRHDQITISRFFFISIIIV